MEDTFDDVNVDDFVSTYRDLYKYSEYKRGDVIRYRNKAGSETSAKILWVAAPTNIAGTDVPGVYVVENAQGGWPDDVSFGKVLGKVE